MAKQVSSSSAPPPFDLTALPCPATILLRSAAANMFCRGVPTSTSNSVGSGVKVLSPSPSISTQLKHRL
ncbi:hypothetical protein [Mesorhizobium sp. WSM2240]|uniref:Lytic murein transglycosylase n=1 Tax=Mesorhizobium sp. WSM2239 TaxID=3228852 RepID=A0AAU8D9I3_9HYPH